MSDFGYDRTADFLRQEASERKRLAARAYAERDYKQAAEHEQKARENVAKAEEKERDDFIITCAALFG